MENLTLEKILELPSVPYHHRDLLPTDGGLYFVLINMGEPVLLYVGKANDINGRWGRSHHRDPEIHLLVKLGIKVDIAWLELRVTESMLYKWENIIIKNLKPVINDTFSIEAFRKTIERNIKKEEKYKRPPMYKGMRPNETEENTEVKVIDIPTVTRNSDRDEIKQQVRNMLYRGYGIMKIVKDIWGTDGGKAYMKARDELDKILEELNLEPGIQGRSPISFIRGYENKNSC